jgi:hypothetical protein
MGIRVDIITEYEFFLAHYHVRPNMLLLHPSAVDELHFDQDYRAAALELRASVPATWNGMVVYVSYDVKRFRVALSIDDRDCAGG